MFVLIRDAIEKFYRAQGYMDKDPNSSIQVSSAKGAIHKAYKQMKEALWNAEQALKLAKDLNEVNAIYEAKDGLTGGVGGEPIKFNHHHINEAWNDYALAPWIKEFNKLYEKHASRFN